MGTSTLDATAAGASSNSYVTLAAADQYHDDRPAAGTTWADASENNKIRALLWATVLLDDHFEWSGSVETEAQRLAWPRSGLATPNGYNLDSDTVPEAIADATAEYARQLLVADRAADSEVETQGLTNLKVGSIALGFEDNVYAKNVPDAVVWLIPRPWARLRGSSGVKTLLRA